MAYRILITGSRDWRDPAAILDALSQATAHLPPGELITVVHGACPTGADNMAWTIARNLNLQVEPHPADWLGPCRWGCVPGHRRGHAGGSSYCPKAGHYRNQEMVDLGADVVLAFQRHRSRGTQDCVTRARIAGLRVVLKEG